MHRCLTIGNMPIRLLGSMGKRLRALREERELDQTQFAAAVSRRHAFGRPVSVSNSFVSKLEGGYKPSVEVLVALADELGVSADYILMRSDIPDTADAVAAEYARMMDTAAPDMGVGVSPEAEEIARLIDDTPAIRAVALDIVRALVQHWPESDAPDPALIERAATFAESALARVPQGREPQIRKR